MSGLEVVGAILGVVPLVVEAYDHSDSMFKAISVLGKNTAAREIRGLKIKFSNQKSIFRASTTRILSAISNDRNGVIHRLSSYLSQDGRNHDAIRNDEEDNILDVLHGLLRDYEATLQEIFRYLGLITQSSKAIQGESEETHHTSLNSRITFAWERSEIKPQIAELRELVGDFDNIGQKIVHFLHDHEVPQPYKHVTEEKQSSGGSLSKLDVYKSIRHACSRLYCTMSEKWCCDLHHKHVVHLSSIWVPERYTATGPISLMVVVSPYDGYDDDSVDTHLIKLEVQHCQCGNITDSSRSRPDNNSHYDADRPKMTPHNQEMDSLASSLQKGSKGWMPEIPKNETKKLQRRPKYNPLHNNIPLESLSLADTPSENKMNRTQDSIADLQYVSDYCTHFNEQVKCCSSRTCLGYLAHPCMDRFYMQPSQQESDHEIPLSLADLICQTSNDPLPQTFPRSLTMNLACSIADAVLQLYSTPWLPERWESKDIHLFGIGSFNNNEDILKSRPLYFPLTFVKNSKGKETVGTSRKPLGLHVPSSSMAQILDVGVRNERLFCLGIVLLELGYEKPWGILRIAEIKGLDANHISEYLVADRLAKKLVIRMGPNYVRIIRKCIACDFGLGEANFDNEDLQKKFVEEVIEVLRGVGDGLEAFSVRYSIPPSNRPAFIR